MTSQEREYQRAVSDLQTFLRRLSHTYITIPALISDGIFGQKTKHAVEEFQRLMGMEITGVADTLTWNAIVDEYNTIEKIQTPASFVPFFPRLGIFIAGDNGDAVYVAQVMLKRLSKLYDNMQDVEITGVMDDKTVAALKILQDNSCEDACGELNKETWEHLARLYTLHHDYTHPLHNGR